MPRPTSLANEWTSGFTPAILHSFHAANESDEEFQQSEWSYALAWKVLGWTFRWAKWRDETPEDEWQEIKEYRWVRVHR
jgi:hypothetical protein